MLFAVLTLSACDFSGGQFIDSTAPIVTATVNGVASNGLPMAAAPVMLKDQAGRAVSSTTGSDGRYTLNVTGLTPPFLISAGTGAATRFGAAVASGTANVHKYTDLAMRAYFQAQGTDAPTAFVNASSATVLPKKVDLDNLSGELNGDLRSLLIKTGVSNPETFNIFTTPFVANSVGFDKLLDNTSYTPSNGTYTVTAGTVTQTATVTGSNGHISAKTTTTDSSTGASSSTSADVGVSGSQQSQTDQQAMVDCVGAMLTNLTAGNFSNAAAFIDPAFLDRGDNAAALAQKFSSLPPGQQISFQSVDRVYAFTSSPKTLLTASVAFQVTSGGQTFGLSFGGPSSNDDGRHGNVYIRESDGSCKFYGDQTLAYVNLRVDNNRSYSGSGSNAGVGFQIDARAPFATPPSQGNPLGVGTVSTVTIANTGGKTLLPSCSGPSPQPLNSAGPITLTEANNNGSAITSNGREQFSNNACSNQVTPLPPAGTQYLATAHPQGGGADSTITGVIESQTNEFANLVAINGMAPSTFLSGKHAADVIGQQLALTWTLPTSFSIANTSLQLAVSDANSNSDHFGNGENGFVATTATSGSLIAIPAKLKNGNNVTRVEGRVGFFGTHGEHTAANFTIQ